MTIKYIKRQVLAETGWLQGINAVWNRYWDASDNRLNPKQIPAGERPYSVDYCEKCNCQRLHILCDNAEGWLVFECSYYNDNQEEL